MPYREHLVPYTLKLSHQLWMEIDDARTLLVGTLSPEPVSKKAFIETAVREYLSYLNAELAPRIKKVTESTEAPIAFYSDNGVDLVY